MLTGETEATEGTVWKHPNLRIAYVAQHAFHHIEQHLDKTPNEYIQVNTLQLCWLWWRHSFRWQSSDAAWQQTCCSRG